MPWRVKSYGLAVTPSGPGPALIDAADAATATTLQLGQLPSTSGQDRPTWVAFTIIHDARPACFVQIDQWRNDVDLVQRYLTSPPYQPDRWSPSPAAPSDESGNSPLSPTSGMPGSSTS